MPQGKKERIAKLLARAGVASRRDIERMLGEGRIALDGQVLTKPAVLLRNLKGVTVDGKAIAATEPVQIWRYHKPPGLVTTHKDPQGRPTVFNALPSALPRVISVGRLDLNSEGLLLLTNDGTVARFLELPSTGMTRRYRVRVHGAVDPDKLAQLQDGLKLDGVDYGPVEAKLERRQGSNAWLNVTLSEGKNREIRKILASQGLIVTRLIRTAYGPFLLGRLNPGEVKAIPRSAWIDVVAPIRRELRAIAAAGKPAQPKGWAKAKPRPRKPPRAVTTRGQKPRRGKTRSKLRDG